MQLKRINQQHLKAQLTNAELRSVVKSEPEFDQVLQTIGTQPVGIPILLFTSAKAYCRGGGWWDIMGYAYDGSDIEHVIHRLDPLRVDTDPS